MTLSITASIDIEKQDFEIESRFVGIYQHLTTMMNYAYAAFYLCAKPSSRKCLPSSSVYRKESSDQCTGLEVMSATFDLSTMNVSAVPSRAMETIVISTNNIKASRLYKLRAIGVWMQTGTALEKSGNSLYLHPK